MSLPRQRLAGMFDLPRELREIIYNYILPVDRIMCFPATQHGPGERATMAVCAAHGILRAEIEDRMYKQCEGRLVITPDVELDMPAWIEWWRFRTITVTVTRLARDPGWYRHEDFGNCLIGLKQAIGRLQHGAPTMLPHLEIWLDDRDRLEGTASWYQTVSARRGYEWVADWESSRKDWFHRLDQEAGEYWDAEYRPDSADRPDGLDVWLSCTHDLYFEPIAVRILECFLALPPCKSLCVPSLLELLQPRRICTPRGDPRRRIFDADYAGDMCTTLEHWLAGRRKDVRLPTGRDEFGRPILEQLAYSQYNGRAYVDQRFEYTEDGEVKGVAC